MQAGLLTWASRPESVSLTTCHSAGRRMKSPEIGCRGPRCGGQSRLGLLERSSEQTLTAPENSDLGSGTQGLLAGDSLRALLTQQARRGMLKSY